MEAAELRYADCPTTEAELRIDAPPAVVWPLVCDIQTPAEFSSEFQGGAVARRRDAPGARGAVPRP